MEELVKIYNTINEKLGYIGSNEVLENEIAIKGL